MTIKELQAESFNTATEKGWHDEPDRTALEYHMLMVSEIAEATEEHRNNKPPLYFADGTVKPEGEAVELADAVIRIADYFGKMGWDLEEILRIKLEFNKTRSYRHGNKLK